MICSAAPDFFRRWLRHLPTPRRRFHGTCGAIERHGENQIFLYVWRVSIMVIYVSMVFNIYIYILVYNVRIGIYIHQLTNQFMEDFTTNASIS